MNCVLVGDFNLNYLDKTLYSNRIKNVSNVFGIGQLVKVPTRVTAECESLIDYVLVNTESFTTQVHDSPKIADHSIISVNFFKSHKSARSYVHQYRNMCEDNLTCIRTSLISCNWSFNSTDVNILYNEILNTCDEVINAAAPIQYCKYRNDIPWFDAELHNTRKIKIRDASYKDFKASSGNEKHNKWEIFKKHKDDVVNSLKVKKSRYYNNKLDEYKNDLYKMRKMLKKLVNVNIQDFPRYIRFENSNNSVIIKDVALIAENFNHFFIGSIQDIVDSIDIQQTWSNVNQKFVPAFFKILNR
nr:unnamed protein product [Callosobruchus analis]